MTTLIRVLIDGEVRLSRTVLNDNLDELILRIEPWLARIPASRLAVLADHEGITSIRYSRRT